MKFLAVFAFCLTLVQSQELKCYNCGGSENCTSPVQHNVEAIVCESRHTLPPDVNSIGNNLFFECFSFKWNIGNASGGIYRGCTSRIGDISTACSVYEQTYGNVIDCKTCDTDRCNSNSSTDMLLSLYTIFLSVFIFSI